jgi:formate dehydrogenase major subunit
MIRRHGKLEADSWESALDYVVNRLRGLIARGKPVGVLGSPRATNEENYLAGRLARAGLQTNHIDFCYHSICRPLIEGVEDVAGESPHPIRLRDIEASDTIVLLEGDLATTHPRAASLVLKAVASGARLVVIGCAQTQMARLASVFLKTAPGREGDAINSLLAAALPREPETRRCDGYDSVRRDLAASEVSDEVRVASEEIVKAKQATFLIGPSAGPPDRLRGTAASLATLAVPPSTVWPETLASTSGSPSASEPLVRRSVMAVLAPSTGRE